MDRRQFLGITTVTGTTLIAGCGASTDDSSTTPAGGTATGTNETPMETADGGTTTGSFRLLISDRPADISDFDSLDVTFDQARVHRDQSESDDGDESTATETADDGDESTATETADDGDGSTATETADDGDESTATETADDGDGSDGERGFTVFDLDEPTVDLTQVVGEKAIGVLDGRLETGRYSKIELYVADVEGVVDGETVPVKVPSNKLQITTSFEITADSSVEFVFDINVVKRGPNGYNLLPVISESGVAGEDVDVEEVDPDDEQESATATGTETDTETGNRGGGNQARANN